LTFVGVSFFWSAVPASAKSLPNRVTASRNWRSGRSAGVRLVPFFVALAFAALVVFTSGATLALVSRTGLSSTFASDGVLCWTGVVGGAI
jgi:hypothetical protein